jgi:hypothetical protein
MLSVGVNVKERGWHALTNSNDSAELRLFVLVGGSCDGTEKNERDNCKEYERHRAEEVSTLPPSRTTNRVRDHGEVRKKSSGVLYQTLE